MIYKEKVDILNWLRKYAKIKEDSVSFRQENDLLYVDINESVILSKKNIKIIPFQFGIIDGDFIIGSNLLSSLSGCPEIVKGMFSCSFNKLSSLIGGPRIVNGSYHAKKNNLISLKGLPLKIEGYLNLSDNKLQLLEGISQYIKGDLIIDKNKLRTFKGINYVGGNISATYNNIANFNFLPKQLNGDLILTHNRLKSFKYIPSKINGHLDISFNPINSLNYFDCELKMLKHDSLIAIEELKPFYNKNGFSLGKINTLMISGEQLQPFLLSKKLDSSLEIRKDHKKIKI